MSFVSIALTRLGQGLLSSVAEALFSVALLLWDLGLFLYNLVAPAREEGKVTPAGHPGFGGVWPEYVAPKSGDSRCSCPALNAMANHGILPRDGRNIPIRSLSPTIRATYNFAPTFCLFVPRYIAQVLGRSYLDDTLDLSDIDVHNGIEHDASLTREDSFHSPDQSRPALAVISELLAAASGPALSPKNATSTSTGMKDGVKIDYERSLTVADLAHITGKRRTEARQRNGQYSLSTFHKLFGSSNSATLLTIFGGRLPDIHTLLTEERLPQGWESRVLEPMGLTMTAFQKTVLGVELGVKEETINAFRSLY